MFKFKINDAIKLETAIKKGSKTTDIGISIDDMRNNNLFVEVPKGLYQIIDIENSSRCVFNVLLKSESNEEFYYVPDVVLDQVL